MKSYENVPSKRQGMFVCELSETVCRRKKRCSFCFGYVGVCADVYLNLNGQHVCGEAGFELR